jgi:glycerol kinase
VTKVTLGTGGFINTNTGNTCLAATGADPIVAWKIGDEVFSYRLE